jgi:sterol 24-C-methyltransferase
MNFYQQKVIRYYSSLESRLGYNLFLHGSKHFGYYPDSQPNISEAEAQEKMHDKVAEVLHLTSRDYVLDAGCGQGIVSTYLAKKFHSKIMGITIVPFEVTAANKKAVQLQVQDKLEYKLLDYMDTKFPNNTFDAIYTTETLSHAPDIHKVLQEFYRILKPGGRLALFEYTMAPDARFTPHEKAILDLVIDGSAMMGLRNFRHDNFTTIIANSGFTNVTEQNISQNVRPSFYRLHQKALIPYLLIKFFHLQHFFINTTTAIELYRMAEKDLLRYCIFTAQKP